jgi:AcrR family transcriptional regulator
MDEEGAPARLTARGAATRARMVRAAADLIRVKGSSATSVDDVLRASATGKSQFYKYFGDKESLIVAATEYQSAVFLGGQAAVLENLRNVRGLRRWRDALVQSNSLQNGAYGCMIGSLAIEIGATNERARLVLDDAFVQWQGLLEAGLRRMQTLGVLSAEAEVAELATGLIAAVEGGYLLGQVAHSTDPVAISIDVALARIEKLIIPPKASA